MPAKLLTGTAIATALQRTAYPIEVRDPTAVELLPAKLHTWAEIEPFLARDFEAIGTGQRVYYLRPPVPVSARRPELPFEPCYLNSKAPVLRFWADQVSPGVGAMVDRFV